MKSLSSLLITCCIVISCSNSQDIGYQSTIFKNSNSWELAKAVMLEDEIKMNELLASSKIDINYQEPVFHSTVLHLAIGNDKVRAVRILLHHKADITLVDIDNRAAIHEAVNDIKARRNSYEIIKLLIAYGADLNMVRISPNGGNDTLGNAVPLCDAVNDLKCTQLLIEHGANPYYKTGNTYPVWYLMLLMSRINDNIKVAKYFIIDKKMLVPTPITYNISGKPQDVFTLLNDVDLSTSPERQKIKDEILDYLRDAGFPSRNVYSK